MNKQESLQLESLESRERPADACGQNHFLPPGVIRALIRNLIRR